MAVREGRFVYQGGTLPARCPYALPQLKAALGAVAGLRGFVGVDFIWDTEREHATILEINPRPTTSYVGTVPVASTRCAGTVVAGRLGNGRRQCRDACGFGRPSWTTPWAECRSGPTVSFVTMTLEHYSHEHTRRGQSTVDRAWISAGPTSRVAHECGHARTVPFEVWKRPDELGRAIAAAAAALPTSDRAAVTMTAELSDCYPTKATGVSAVLDAVSEGLPGRSIVVWGVDGAFHSVAEARRQPHLAAAANWLALASLAARLIPEECGLLIDIGSTTTDLIPLDRGQVVARGRSDTERLQTGELVYAGVRRTPVCALATELPLRGITTGLAAEIFASTLDVYLTLGDIESNAERSVDGRWPAGHRVVGTRPPGPNGRRRPRRLFARRCAQVLRSLLRNA